MTVTPIDRAPCDPAAPLRIGLLVAHSGAQLQGLFEASRDPAQALSVEAVVSINKEAPVLERARKAGFFTRVLSADAFADRESQGEAIVEVFATREVEVICLIDQQPPPSPLLFDRYPFRVLGAHASLLPALPGPDPIERALAQGLRITGCSLYLLAEDGSPGAMFLQSALNVWPDDDVDSLAVRLSVLMQRQWCDGLRLMAQGRVQIQDGRVVIAGLHHEDRLLAWYVAEEPEG